MEGKKIKALLGITGSIAAYKSPLIARELVKRGIDVYAVFTENAKRFTTIYTLQAITGNPVFDKMFYESSRTVYPHIELSKNADIVIVAPATANFIAKAALGIADDLLSALFLACKCKKVVCPAMNSNMYENEITRRNVDSLRQSGVYIIEPESGDLACGDKGIGRMRNHMEIVERVFKLLEDEAKEK